jgi:hypothetical protein
VIVFIHVHMTYQAPDIARVFINEIVRLHGMPKMIISDRGLVFTGRFGLVSKWPWEPNLTLVQCITRIQTSILNEKTKSSWTCCVCMLWTNRSVGNNSFHWWNLHITTVIKAPLRWHLSSFFTGDHVGRL